MDQLISALVLFEGGTHCFKEPYQVNISAEQYIEHFTLETQRANNKPRAVLVYLKKTKHTEDGSYVIDESGDIVYETLYVNPDIHL